MTIDDIKDKVPSSITIMPDEDDDSIAVLVNNTYTGYLYVTPEGVYFETWLRLTNQDDYYRLNAFLERFEFELLICIRLNVSNYRIYRLIE